MDSPISCVIAADSKNRNGTRITTMVLTYPRFIHSELMTHRAFSRNAASSRAIPVSRMLRQVREAPVVPLYWGANKPGMQAGEELQGEARSNAIDIWRNAAQQAAEHAEGLAALGVHKQIANRLLEPFQLMKTIVTATEWENFFSLRIHKDAEPHFNELASKMKKAMDVSVPNEAVLHAPFVGPEEARKFSRLATIMQISAARCARVSYLNHDGTEPDAEKDLELANKLATNKHASPFEHPAISMHGRYANFSNWRSMRHIMGL